MDAFISLLRSSFFKTIFIGIIFLIHFTELHASSRGCCSQHNGIASCNTTTGYLMCKDGVQSPSCKCTIDNTTTKTQTITIHDILSTIPTTGTTSTTASKRGCCKGHGGVAGCDAASGYQKCKDGTLSSTCKCTPSTKKTKTKKTTITIPTPSAETTKASQRGCCKGHGGVAGCDTKSGYKKCKDGTLSTTCKCP